MTKLSANLNRVALLRNSRDIGIPNVLEFGRICLDAGAHGLTVHPRPDQRHIRPQDVHDISTLIRQDYPHAEFNIEGNPTPEFIEFVLAVKPDQCTMVPDEPQALTSDAGWDTRAQGERVKPIIAKLKDAGIRTSLFMETDIDLIELAAEAGTDRVELYTGPYALAYDSPDRDSVFQQYYSAAKTAAACGLQLNGGHDLNLDNLGLFRTVPSLLEVSIGHALIGDALRLGMANAVRAYLDILAG